MSVRVCVCVTAAQVVTLWHHRSNSEFKVRIRHLWHHSDIMDLTSHNFIFGGGWSPYLGMICRLNIWGGWSPYLAMICRLHIWAWLISHWHVHIWACQHSQGPWCGSPYLDMPKYGVYIGREQRSPVRGAASYWFIHGKELWMHDLSVA